MTEFFTQIESEEIRDALDILNERDSEMDVTERAPISFDLSGRSSAGTGSTDPTEVREWRAYCAIHRPNRDTQPKRAILELELFDENAIISTRSSIKPPVPRIFRSAFDDPDRLDMRPGMQSDQTVQPSEEDLFESTVSLVQPLKAMVRLRKQEEKQRMHQNRQKGGGQPSGKAGKAGNNQSTRHGELHIVQLLTQVDEQFRRADDLSTFSKVRISYVVPLDCGSLTLCSKLDYGGIAQRIDRV